MRYCHSIDCNERVSALERWFSLSMLPEKTRCPYCQGAYESIRTGNLEPWGIEPERSQFRKRPRRNWAGIRFRNESAKLFLPRAGGHCCCACVSPTGWTQSLLLLDQSTHSASHSGKPWALRRFPLGGHVPSQPAANSFEQLHHLRAVQPTRNHSVSGSDCRGAASTDSQCESAPEGIPPKQLPRSALHLRNNGGSPPGFTGRDFLQVDTVRSFPVACLGRHIKYMVIVLASESKRDLKPCWSYFLL